MMEPWDESEGRTMARAWRQRILDTSERIDRFVLDQLKQRATLIAALIGLTFLGWSALTQNGYLGLQVLLAGAVGYLLGFVPAVVGGLAVNVVDLCIHGAHGVNVYMLLVQLFGCTYIAWLGHAHRIAAAVRRKEIQEMQNRKHIVPWTVVNEVRNSLLAVRLLLFSNRTVRVSPSEMRLIEDELLRLEAMLKDLPEQEAAAKHKSGLRAEPT
ncbi:MAG: hypothetical protein ACYCVB_16450 [Bacilli bacterium]